MLCFLLIVVLRSSKGSLLEDVENLYNQTNVCRLNTALNLGKLPPGWLSREEACVLYCLGYTSGGAIAEQGSFLGRSTACIATGIRAALKMKKSSYAPLFISADVFPIGKKFLDDNVEFAVGAKYYWSTNYTLQIGGEMVGSVPKTEYDKNIGKYVDVGSQMDWLRYFLQKDDLLKYVTIIAAEKLPPHFQFDVIWSDAAHDVNEINKNEIGWKKMFLKRNHPITFAFHDTTLQNKQRLLSIFSKIGTILHTFQAGSIFLLEVKKK